MKRLLPVTFGTVACLVVMCAGSQAADSLPGQVDFGVFSPPKGGGEFVEVNLPTSLIALGARLVEKDQPDLAKLLNGLKLVRVNVIGLDDDNRAELQKRGQKIAKELSGKGWERIVAAQQKDQDVAIYLKLTEKGGVQGLVAVVTDGTQHAVFVNIVGEIKPEQVSMLGDKLHLDPLKNIGRPPEKREDNPKAED